MVKLWKKIKRKGQRKILYYQVRSAVAQVLLASCLTATNKYFTCLNRYTFLGQFICNPKIT